MPHVCLWITFFLSFKGKSYDFESASNELNLHLQISSITFKPSTQQPSSLCLSKKHRMRIYHAGAIFALLCFLCQHVIGVLASDHTKVATEQLKSFMWISHQGYTFPFIWNSFKYCLAVQYIFLADLVPKDIIQLAFLLCGGKHVNVNHMFNQKHEGISWKWTYFEQLWQK